MRIPKALPNWKNPRHNKYFSLLFLGCPPWYRESPEMRAQYYAMCRRRDEMRARGENVELDHIVPVVSDKVCGLNVHWNLEIRSAAVNGKKSNRIWPQMPGEQPDFFETESTDRFFIEPYQAGLQL